ncbi:MAG: DUF721 domain-containing protein [Deltaproteobacteria bacterium]|nr:DUF721 domain-containing protein [Deltaproteobacteria bacterium]
MAEKRKNSEPNPHPAGSILQGLLKEAGFERQIRRFSVFEDWPDLVGPTLAAHSQPWRVRGDVLEVRVDHAVWMQQLQLQKSSILKQLNARLEGDSIRDLFWCFGTIRPSEENSHPASENQPESSADSE